MRPHEEAKLLSPEDLAEAKFPLTLEEWRRVLAHIAALEADNAALLDTLRGVMGHVRISSADMGGNHRYSITNDYGCSADMGRGRIVADADNHPGATLLSEHAKALVRARNEGLERARKYVHENLHLVPEAAAIDAMKETEP